ncbi:hypothetical protein [Massilia aerilata]|uniref:Uncharacterized protein n=1 Tax=Massilia aerilata TaxID=453817 RepID=A0ABW0RZW5_9BURK
MILKGYFSMRKNLAGASSNFHVATKARRPDETCPQFLWINLCGIPFPYGKSLILLMEILAIKFVAAPQPRNLPTARPASAHFLWTKLCASARSGTKPLDS